MLVKMKTMKEESQKIIEKELSFSQTRTRISMKKTRERKKTNRKMENR